MSEPTRDDVADVLRAERAAIIDIARQLIDTYEKMGSSLGAPTRDRVVQILCGGALSLVTLARMIGLSLGDVQHTIDLLWSVSIGADVTGPGDGGIH